MSHISLYEARPCLTPVDDKFTMVHLDVRKKEAREMLYLINNPRMFNLGIDDLAEKP